MGSSSGKYANATGDGKKGTTRIIDMQKDFEKITVPLEVKVAHYTPSSFPMVPVITKHTSRIISESWQVICKAEVSDGVGGTTTGITAFYNEFYERLDHLDTSGRFEAVLTRNTDGGTNKIQAKGAILVRIVKFIMSIEGDTRDVQYSLYVLGKSHSHKGIRPWQYSIFVQTLLMTISSRLGTSATNDVMEAWVNMFAFVMKSMLPPAIEHQVVETEISVNTSSEFASDKIREELMAAEEVKEIRRRFKNGGTASSASGSPRDRCIPEEF